jgi:hypothetical protein
VGEIIGLMLGNVVGGLLGNIACSFVGENVGDENVWLLVGCAFGEEIVAIKTKGNIDDVKVGVSVSVVVVGSYAGEILDYWRVMLSDSRLDYLRNLLLATLSEYMKDFFWESLLELELGYYLA